MGCCVSRAADADGASPAVSSKYAPKEEACIMSDAFVPNDNEFDVSSDPHESALTLEVREVLGDLDARTRSVLAPALSRNAGRTLRDLYDVSNARRVGKGGFSVVYAVRHKTTNETVAAKVVTIQSSGDAVGVADDEKTATKVTTSRRDAIRATLCEAAVAAVASHDTVCAFRDLLIEDAKLVLIHEFCAGGSLLDIVQETVDTKRLAKKQKIQETKRRSREHRRSTSGSGNSVLDEFDAHVYDRAERELVEVTENAHVAKCGGALAEHDARVACRRVAQALAKLHTSGFAHRDVKLENLLLSNSGDLTSLKLADFGFATVVSDKHGARLDLFEKKDMVGDRLQGTCEYAAPEIFTDLAAEEKEEQSERRSSVETKNVYPKGGGGGGSEVLLPTQSVTPATPRRRLERVRSSAQKSARPEVDVWSLGVVTFLMLGGYHVFGAASRDARLNASETLRVEFLKPQWANISADAKRVIARMLCPDPKKRITAARLLKDKWVMSD